MFLSFFIFQVRHMFEECDWRPFVSNEAPKYRNILKFLLHLFIFLSREDTWDGEDRHGAIKAGTAEHVNGLAPFPPKTEIK